jgi:hypothetical protein
MVQNKKTYYQIILDMSASMGDCLNETINGFNKQMESIAKLQEKHPEQKFLVSLTTFNSDSKIQFEFLEPSSSISLTKWSRWWHKSAEQIQYSPSGMTALYDAIGQSCESVMGKAKEELDNNLATVVVVIITDGHENASTTYKYVDIQDMIKSLEKTESWIFNYMSSTPDYVEYSKGMNIKKENTMCFTVENMEETFENVSASMSSYASEKKLNIKPSKFFDNF